MTLFEHIVIWAGVAVVLYGVFAGIVALRAIIKHRDGEYRAMYEEHLRRKYRVEDRIEGARRTKKG